MSWSISRSGKPAEVAKGVAQDAAEAVGYVTRHSEAEGAVLHAAVSAALAAAGACHPDAAVSVSLYGSETTHHPDGLPPLRAQSVSLSFSAQLPPLG